MAGIIIGVTIICILLALMFLSSRRYVRLTRDFVVYWKTKDSAKSVTSRYTLDLDMFRQGLLVEYDRKFAKLLSELMSEKNFLNFDYISIRNKDGELLEAYPSFSICDSGEVSMMMNNGDTHKVEFTRTIRGATLSLTFTQNELTYSLSHSGVSVNSNVIAKTDKVR